MVSKKTLKGGGFMDKRFLKFSLAGVLSGLGLITAFSTAESAKKVEAKPKEVALFKLVTAVTERSKISM
jgi:hypothetical protein